MSIPSKSTPDHVGGEPDWEIARLFPPQGAWTEEEYLALIVEIVNNDDPNRDLVVKREDDAKAGIREYWIVDPRDETIRVLSLAASGTEYTEAGLYYRGDRAASVLLTGLEIDVATAFSQPQLPK